MGKMVPVEEVFWCFWFFVASRACSVNNVCWVVHWRESSWYPFMNEFLNSTNFGNLIKIIQCNLDLWQCLLRTSGGALNAKKCSWTPFIWSYNKYGHAHLASIPSKFPFTIQTQDMHRNTYKLKINQPNYAIHLLSIDIAADGSYDKELSVLKQKQDWYVQFLLCTPLSHCKAQVIYKQCYLPMVTYLLPATTIPQKKIYNTQLMVTSLFHAWMGYLQHLPHSIIFAPELIGRLSLCHLGIEQGVQQVLQQLSHLCFWSKNGQLYTLTIEAYQISAGLSCPILEDTCPLPWMQHGWINCICWFLYSIQGQIILKDPWVPTSWREHDWCIMDDVFSQISSINFETFNNIRLYLWVHMLSKIVNSNGK